MFSDEFQPQSLLQQPARLDGVHKLDIIPHPKRLLSNGFSKYHKCTSGGAASPLNTEEECFRAACEGLPGRLKRIPDGEPGDRKNFARWQLDLFKYEPRLLNESFSPDRPKPLTEEEANEVFTVHPEARHSLRTTSR